MCARRNLFTLCRPFFRLISTPSDLDVGHTASLSMSVLSIQCVLLQYVCAVYTVCTASVCLCCLYSLYCFSMSVLSIQSLLLQYVCTVYTVSTASVCLYFLYSVYCFSMSVLSIQCVLLQQNRVSAAVVFIRSFRFTSYLMVLGF